MMGVAGMKKGDRQDRRQNVDPEALKALEAGAALSVNGVSRAVFKRYNFSLTEAVSADIDSLSLTPRDFRASRSDVVKAGVLALQRMSEAELIAFLREVAQP